MAHGDRASPVTEDPWRPLRELTAARIALGRAGGSLPTRAHLDFQMAHARARDAVHRALDVDAALTALDGVGLPVLRVHSAAADRREFLLRPDLGRRLSEASRARLAAAQDAAQDAARGAGRDTDAVFVVADGLSALAVERHAGPLLGRVVPELRREGWTLAPVVLAEQGRVALGDEVGEQLGARLAAVLIGERPGLSAPDSLGVYLTFAPRLGRADAERNCVSNVRPEGLDYPAAAHKLLWLMREARRRRLTGVGLKEEAPALGARPSTDQGLLSNEY
jgi:ethanolamine ammonia-lyase small subunit